MIFLANDKSIYRLMFYVHSRKRSSAHDSYYFGMGVKSNVSILSQFHLQNLIAGESSDVL